MKCIVILFSIVAYSNLYAWNESHGGNSAVFEARDMSLELCYESGRALANSQWLMAFSDRCLPVIQKVTFYSTDILYLDGQEVDAINNIAYPISIALNRRRWDEMGKVQKERLLIHELLFLLMLDDSNYEKSRIVHQAILDSR